MFVREAFKAPLGSDQSFEVRYSKGRKPFADLPAATAFAKEQRALPDGWAEVSQVIKIVVDKRS